MPGNAGVQTALRVTLADLPEPFEEDYEGSTMWVGAPCDVSEKAATSGSSPPDFVAATLTCDRVYLDWSTVGRVHVYGNAIVPGAAYEIQVIRENCDPAWENNYSEALSIATSVWGDVVGEYFTDPADCMVMPSGYVDCWSPPNGAVNFDDISALVDKFNNLGGAPSKSRADIAGPAEQDGTPDRLVNFVDISYCVDAFRGLPYLFPGPTGCP